MSVNYTSVVGVGVMEDELDYTSLTEQSKKLIKDIYYNDFCGDGNEEDIADWFSENIGEYELWYELGLEKNTGNYFTGETGYRGVEVNLNDMESAKEEFRKIVNLEPEVFNGVLVW